MHILIVWLMSLVTALAQHSPAHASRSEVRAPLQTHSSYLGWMRERMDTPQFFCTKSLWFSESKMRVDAQNNSSGAYGIPQALPAWKMASAGADWRTNGYTQMEWGLKYIRERYGSGCNALYHFNLHGWY